MSFQNICAPAPVVSVVNNTVTALSTDVAKLFSKLHKDVLRSIRSLIEQAPSLNERNFALVEVKDAKGENRPAYRMDRKGFVLLAMGFTGEVALKFKIAYIDAFDTMERKLYQGNVTSTDTITNAQQVAIQQAVARRAKKTAVYYQTIYRALKRRFRIPRYTCLLQRDFETALAFIDALKVSDFNVPDVKEESPTPEVKQVHAKYVVQFPSLTISASNPAPCPAIPAVPVSKHYITDNELEAIKSLIYYFDDLFKPQIQWASKEAYRQGRSDASRFYDVWHEPMWFISRMRQLVSRNS